MEELIENAEEFIASAEDNIKKERWNAAVADFFRAIANLCDYLIYKEIKIIPKNHAERFDLLKKYFINIFERVDKLFEKYRESYNLRMKEEDARMLKSYVEELKNAIRENKE